MALVAAPFELAGGPHPQAVAIQQHAKQGLGVVAGMAVPIVAVLPVERVEVELVDHVEDEPGEVAFGEPVAQVGREQEGLVAVAAQEVVRHITFYSIYYVNDQIRRSPGLGIQPRRQLTAPQVDGGRANHDQGRPQMPGARKKRCGDDVRNGSGTVGR
jgi:hypothetical protein